MRFLVLLLVVFSAIQLAIAVTNIKWEDVFANDGIKNSNLGRYELSVFFKQVQSQIHSNEGYFGVTLDDVVFLSRANTSSLNKCNYYYLNDLQAHIEKFQKAKRETAADYLRERQAEQFDLCISTLDKNFHLAQSGLIIKEKVTQFMETMNEFKEAPIEQGFGNFLKRYDLLEKEPKKKLLGKGSPDWFKGCYNKHISILCKIVLDSFTEPMSLYTHTEETPIKDRISDFSRNWAHLVGKCEEEEEKREEIIEKTFKFLTQK